MRVILILSGLAGLLCHHNFVHAQEDAAAMTTVVVGTETFTLPAFTNGGEAPPNPPPEVSTATGPPVVSIPSPSVTPTNTVTLGGGGGGGDDDPWTQTGYGSPPPASNTGDIMGPSPVPSPSHGGQPPTISTAGAPEPRAMGAVVGAFGFGAVAAVAAAGVF
jgi:hypothetical protein